MEQDKARETTRRLKAAWMALVAIVATAGYFWALIIGKAGPGWIAALLVFDFAAVALIRYSDETPPSSKVAARGGRPYDPGAN